MKSLVNAARIEAEVKVVSSKKSFSELFKYMSKDAAVVFMGMGPVDDEHCLNFYHSMNNNLEGMPVTFLVNSNGQADLFA